ncbi:MAG: type II toxin-antitoxin system RelE/ParE family toxin, partial [Psychromonas sp.]|nr:type II toxin-antitoxin system RelE/ParE family toxin [Psychromonas sp.]
MEGLFVESSLFEKHRQEYLSDEQYRTLQNELLLVPTKGDVISATGGLRKVRVATKGKGKRGGGRVIYYYFHHFKRF